MLKLGCDEITVVLRLSNSAKNSILPEDFDWEDIAPCIMAKFSMKSGLEQIFGKMQPYGKPPQGYIYAYTFGDHSFYLAMAYHPYQPGMGVICKFSAQSWDYYREQTGEEVYHFLQKVRDKSYTVRLSRIDLTADYIDEGLAPTEICESIRDGSVSAFYEQFSQKTGALEYRRCRAECDGILKDGMIPTIYLGSMRANSRLRIYDKKKEQIQTSGIKYQQAVNCTDWTRFEVSFKYKYAHQITDELMKIQTDAEYANFIANCIAQKYTFMTIDKKSGKAEIPTEYSQMLIDGITNNSFTLSAPSTRNYNLAKSIRYIFHGSGAMSTFHKIADIWGEDALPLLFEYITDSLHERQPTEECNYWIKRYAGEYRKDYPKFDVYLRDNVSPYLSY